MTRKFFSRPIIQFLVLAFLSFVWAMLWYQLSLIEPTSSSDVYNKFAEQAHCTGTATGQYEEGGEFVYTVCQGDTEIARAIQLSEKSRDHEFYEDTMFLGVFVGLTVISAFYTSYVAYSRRKNRKIDHEHVSVG